MATLQDKHTDRLAKFLTRCNDFLDSKTGESLKLRSISQKVIYFSAYNGLKIADRFTPKPKPYDPTKPRSTKGLFDLNYTDEQNLIQNTLQQFALKMRTTAEHTDESGAIDANFWAEFNQLELAYNQVPESYGGIMKEKSALTQMIITETLAYGDLGQALAFLTPQSVLNAITKWGTDDQKKAFIPLFLGANPIKASIAINEPTALFDPFELETTAKKNSNGYLINGVKNMVPLAESSEMFLVAAKLNDEIQIFIVNKNANGLQISKDKGMGLNSAQLGKLKFNDVQVDANAILGNQINYEEFINYCKLGWCALAVGCCQAVLDYTIKYANERHAFGEPISNRQAVAFMIADIKIETDGMRILTQRAASKAEQGLDFKKEVYLAHFMSSEKSMQIGSNGVQLLGGHGFIRDFPVQRWYRDLRAVSIAINGLHL